MTNADIEEKYSSRWYAVTFFLAAMVQVILSAAPIFGYSSLLVIFKDMKLYQQLCPPVINSTSNWTNQSHQRTFRLTCDEQDKALNLPFAFGIILHTAIKAFVGSFIDYVGAKTSQYFGCIFIMLFGVSMAYVQQGMEYLIFVSFFLLSISSSIFLLCPYQVTNVMYKKHKALLLSLLSGSVDSSTVIFIVFLDVYQKGFTLNSIVIGYAVLSTVSLMLIGATLYPSKHALYTMVDVDVRSNLTPKPDKPIVLYAEDFTASCMSSYSMYHASIQKTLDEAAEAEEREALLASLSHSLAMQWSHSYGLIANTNLTMSTDVKAVDKPYGTISEGVVGHSSDEYGKPEDFCVNSTKNIGSEKENLLKPSPACPLKFTPYAGLSLWRYVFSWLYIIFTYVAAVVMLKVTYFIGNLDKYLLEMTDAETRAKYIKYFGYVQFMGVIAGPICSLAFIQRSKSKNNGIQLTAEQDFLEKVKTLVLPSTLTLLLSLLLNALQMLQMLELSIFIFVVFLFTNSILWCLIGIYISYLFPAKYYCTLFGINMGFCGLVTFFQYPLLMLEKDVFHGQQFYVNAIFMALLVSTVALPLYLIYFYKKYKRDDSEDFDSEVLFNAKHV